MQFDTALRLWPAASTIILFILQGAFFVIIKFNDIKHLHLEVKRLDGDMRESNLIQGEVRERLANIEGKLDILVAQKSVNNSEPQQ